MNKRNGNTEAGRQKGTGTGIVGVCIQEGKEGAQPSPLFLIS